MKSLMELNAIKERMRNQSVTRREPAPNDVRVVVGMATCGIAAGARDILSAFINEIAAKNLKNVHVSQSAGVSGGKAPTVEVSLPGKEKVIYSGVTLEMVTRIVNDHIINGKTVAEYLSK